MPNNVILKIENLSISFISQKVETEVIHNISYHLNKNEIFVFGSNESGIHGGGAAYIASSKFGAKLMSVICRIYIVLFSKTKLKDLLK